MIFNIVYFSECCTDSRHSDVTALNTITTSYPAVASLQDCLLLCDTERLSEEDCLAATWHEETADCDLSPSRCFSGECIWPGFTRCPTASMMFHLWVHRCVGSVIRLFQRCFAGDCIIGLCYHTASTLFSRRVGHMGSINTLLQRCLVGE